MELRIFRTESYEEFILELENYEREFHLIVKEIFVMKGKPYKAIVLFEKVEKLKEVEL